MRQISIRDETYERIKEQLGEEKIKEISSYDDLVGESYLFRTVTYHGVGLVVKRVGSFLQLENASWIADSGRFSSAIKEGTLEEVEPVGVMFINLESVVDFFPWVHALPTKQK